MKGKKKKAIDEFQKISEEAVKGKQIGIFVAIGAIVLFLIILSAYNYYASNFTYLDLKFSKVKFGKLDFYYAKIPLFNTNGEITGNYNLYIRNDPRELEDIKINGQIRMKPKIIMASDDIKCEDAGIAGGELGAIIGLWSRIIPGTTNRTIAEKEGKTYASCSLKDGMYIDSTVLTFKTGNVTEIRQTGKDCYEVSVKDCEILRATERFILGLYAHSKGLEIR